MGGFNISRSALSTQNLQQARPIQASQKLPEPQLKAQPLSQPKPKSAPMLTLSASQHALDVATASTKTLARPGDKKFLNPEMLLQAKKKLVPVSQNATLTLHSEHTFESDVHRSAQTLRAKKAGSQFDRDRLPGSEGTLTIVAHSSEGGQKIGGKTPQQMLQFLKQQGITQLDTLHLKSCRSESFSQALKQAIELDGTISIQTIQGFDHSIAIQESTGETLIESGDLLLKDMPGHSGILGKYSVDGLLMGGKIHAPIDVGMAKIIPYKSGVISAEICQQISTTVGQAVDQAMQEFSNGKLLSELATDSGVFLSAHIEGAMKMITEGEHGMLSAKFGYLIEDRVSQILIKNGVCNGQNLQQTIGTSRPDIVLGDDRQIRVDLTAHESVGHILDKTKAAWFADDLAALEVTYPSLPLETIVQGLTGSTFDPKALQMAQAMRLEEQTNFDNFVLTSLRGLADQARQSLGIELSPQGHLTRPEKRKICDEVASQLGLAAIDIKHTFKKFGVLNIDNTILPSMPDVHSILNTVKKLGPLAVEKGYTGDAQQFIDLSRRNLYSSLQGVHNWVEGVD